MAKLKWPRNWSRHLKMNYNLRLMKAELMDENTGLLKTSMWRIGKDLKKNLEQKLMNLVAWVWNSNRKKHGLRKLGTGQVSSGGKCRQHTSFSLESKRKKILVTTFNKGYNFLLLTTWLIHFSSNISIHLFQVLNQRFR